MKSYTPLMLFGATIFAAGHSAGAQELVRLPNPTIKIEVDETPAQVTSYLVTEDGMNHMRQSVFGFEADKSAKVDGTFTLNTNDVRQKIDGFGAGITGSASYNLMQMDAAQRHAFLTQVFSPDHGYGCSYVRVSIGCSDFSFSEYTCCDSEGIGNFALTNEETDYMIPILKEILEINPKLKVMGTPWTAPRWMKTENKWAGGELNPKYYADYGKYFVKWIQEFEKRGVPIYSVTPQNEPLNTNNSAAMIMGWESARDFIKNGLGPALREAGLNTKIYVFDHNYGYDQQYGADPNQVHYPTNIYKDSQASQYIAGAAYHCYDDGKASEMTYVHNQAPDKELIFTEWTAGTWSWPGVGINAVTTDAQALIFDVLNNWGQGSIVWNLVLDSERGPFRPGGCTTGNGVVDVNKDGYHSITYNSFYYVICVAAAATTEGSYYITNSGAANDVSCVSFKNGDGGYGVVLMNRSEDTERKVRITEGTHSFVATLPPRSLASYRW